MDIGPKITKIGLKLPRKCLKKLMNMDSKTTKKLKDYQNCHNVAYKMS